MKSLLTTLAVMVAQLSQRSKMMWGMLVKTAVIAENAAPIVEMQTEGKAFAEVLLMQARRSKSMIEMHNLIIELETRVRHCRELCGNEPEDGALRSVHVGILDGESRRHRTIYFYIS